MFPHIKKSSSKYKNGDSFIVKKDQQCNTEFFCDPVPHFFSLPDCSRQANPTKKDETKGFYSEQISLEQGPQLKVYSKMHKVLKTKQNFMKMKLMEITNINRRQFKVKAPECADYKSRFDSQKNSYQDLYNFNGYHLRDKKPNRMDLVYLSCDLNVSIMKALRSKNII